MVTPFSLKVAWSGKSLIVGLIFFGVCRVGGGGGGRVPPRESIDLIPTSGLICMSKVQDAHAEARHLNVDL